MIDLGISEGLSKSYYTQLTKSNASLIIQEEDEIFICFTCETKRKSAHRIFLFCGHSSCEFCLLIFLEKKLKEGFCIVNEFPCISGQPCLKTINEEIFIFILGKSNFSIKLNEAIIMCEKKESENIEKSIKYYNHLIFFQEFF